MTFGQVWYIRDALIALGQNLAAARKGFNKSDLVQWAPSIKVRMRSVPIAIDHLVRLDFIRRCDMPAGRVRVNQLDFFYQLTPAGKEAAKAADAAASRLVWQTKVTAFCTARTGASPFTARLWALLRVRKQLTAQEAAELLVNAGDTAEFKRARELASRWLLAWSRTCPDAVQPSKHRVANQQVRYVLVNDLGATPPVIPLHGRRAASKASA